MLACTILIASSLVMAQPEHFTPNSVQKYDHAINLSNRVLNRTVCKDIDRTQDVDRELYEVSTPEYRQQLEQASARKKLANVTAVTQHCKRRARSEGISYQEAECNLR